MATLSRGFESTANGDACREVARALPISRGVLVNETGPERLQTCALWVKLFARERGDQVLIREPWTRPGRHEVLVLEDGTLPAGRRIGLVPLVKRSLELLAKQGRSLAIKFLDDLASSELRVERVSEIDESGAIALVRAHADKTYSLCDALSFAVCERLGIGEAISCDDDFRSYGRLSVLL